jgi:hypothetical protein
MNTGAEAPSHVRHVVIPPLALDEMEEHQTAGAGRGA